MPQSDQPAEIRPRSPRADVEEPVSRWVDLDGPTHYLDFGGAADGPLLVCVHGLGGSHLNWSALAPRLSGSCRVLALDLPGFGRTQAGTRSTGVEANQALLHRFLTEVAGTPAVLIGNSMGGMITVLQTAAQPDTVAGVVLVDPAVPQLRFFRPDPVVAFSFLGYALPFVGEGFLAGRRRRFTAEEQVAQTLRLCCVDPGRVEPEVVEGLAALVDERRSFPGIDAQFLLAARTLMRVLARPRTYQAKMGAIDVPVLMLHGTGDRLVPIGAARAVARSNPDWRFEEADGVGHVPQLEAPDWTAEKILDWLAREGRPAAECAERARPPSEELR